MTVDELLAHPGPLSGVSPLVRAMWLDAQGDWDGAHRIAGDEDGAEAAWVHAYLHRKEGDLSNAAYWYARAARAPERGDLGEEWRRIASALLERQGASSGT
jgi:hypothetical protein